MKKALALLRWYPLPLAVAVAVALAPLVAHASGLAECCPLCLTTGCCPFC